VKQDKSWCVLKSYKATIESWNSECEYFAMQTKGTYKPDRIEENLTREEAEGLMKLLRTTHKEN